MVAALFTLSAAFGVASALPNKQVAMSSGTSTLVAQGKEIFLRGCSSCHGLNAEGGGIAPSLIGVGAAAVDFQVGTGRMPMADMSQQAARKKPIYSPAETAALAAYVSSLAPGPAAVTNESLTFERDGNSAEGGQLFRTNCAMCHNFAGQGGALTNGKYAPTVMGVEPKYIFEAMLTGPQSMPKFTNATITAKEKLSIIKWLQEANHEQNQGGASLGRVGPVTEGLLVWTLGIGILIGIAVWLTTKAK
jgi:ubiquinol-cytochrome c reductase cytochrome c subunit